MSEPRTVVVQTTLDDEGRAEALATEIVEARLAACVHRLPVQSTYRWKGAVEHSREILMAAKTREDLAQRLAGFIRERHPYELPEIVVTPIIGGLPEYLAWIGDSTRDGS